VTISAQLKMWFDRPGRPSEESPVGQLMVQLLALNPKLSFDGAREEARARLLRDIAAPDSAPQGVSLP
jgi:hypothetical protein